MPVKYRSGRASAGAGKKGKSKSARKPGFAPTRFKTKGPRSLKKPAKAAPRTSGRSAAGASATARAPSSSARLPRLATEGLTRAVVRRRAAEVPTPLASPAATDLYRIVTAKLPAALAFAPGLERMVAENPLLAQATSSLAERVTFTVATRTRSGRPIQSARGEINQSNLDEFRPDDKARDLALAELKNEGFRVLRAGRFATTVEGPAELLQNVLKQPLMLMRQARKFAVRSAHAFAASSLPPTPQELFLAPSTSLSVKPKSLSAAFDHFVFAPPAIRFAQVSKTPPSSTFHSVGKTDIRRLLRVPSAGAFGGLSGKGVKIGIIDSGFETAHPYFKAIGAKFTAHASPGGSAGNIDLDGHGTAMSFNLFALAPGSEVHGVKQEHPPYTDAIEHAVDDLGADIVTCSWGWDSEQSFPTLEASLASIVEDGKIVLFAAGNGHYAWPGSMPDVISVGGVYADKDSQLEASNYASGFPSGLYPSRFVPDFCGLCGQQPKAIYIPMPVPPGCAMDVELAGNPYADFDETQPNDGWVFASGTSAATPQLAGALALLMEAMRAKGSSLTNNVAKDLIRNSAQQVSRGRNAMGFPATTAQPNGAVGWGLIDVEAMFTLAASRGLI